MNASIYAALNQCSTTGLEKEIAHMTTPQGLVVRLYQDHKGWHRIVLFNSDAPSSGMSGVIVQADGEVYYKETAPDHKGNSYTRMLQAVLTVWGIKWYRSNLLTEAGAACYKN